VRNAFKPKDTQKPVKLPAPNSDFYQTFDSLNQTEQLKVKKVRDFMESKVAPGINKYWLEDSFPFELVPVIESSQKSQEVITQKKNKIRPLFFYLWPT
jgi:hypothetical protein